MAQKKKGASTDRLKRPPAIAGPSTVMTGKIEEGYRPLESVKTEILTARRLCTARGWPVIDVTRRSI